MKVLLSDKECVSNLEGLGFEPMLPHFFLSIIYTRWGWRWWTHVKEARDGGPMWQRAADRGGADHQTELIMYCIYEYKYIKY
jgi:hypothetical protein